MNKKITTAKILHIISLILLIISLAFFLYFYISMLLQTEDNDLGNAIIMILFLYYGSACNAITLIFNIISFFLINKNDIEINSSLAKTKKKYLIFIILLPILEILEIILLLYCH